METKETTATVHLSDQLPKDALKDIPDYAAGPVMGILERILPSQDMSVSEVRVYWKDLDDTENVLSPKCGLVIVTACGKRVLLWPMWDGSILKKVLDDGDSWPDFMPHCKQIRLTEEEAR